MAFVAMARTIKVVIKAHRDTEQRANVLHFQTVGTAVTPADVDNAAAWVDDFVRNHYRQQCSTAVVFDEVDAYDVSVPNGYQKTINESGVAGLQGNKPAPGNVCLVSTLHTAQAGRQGRGRIFLFETTYDNMLVNETWDPGYVASVQTAMNAYLTLLPPGYTVVPAVGSRKGLCSFPITSIKAHNYVASQRDRLPGHRAHHHRHA